MTIHQTFNPAYPVYRNRRRGDAGAAYDVRLTPTENVVVAGDVTFNDVDDAVMGTHVGAVVDKASRVVVAGVIEKPTFQTLTPHIGTVDAEGFVTRVSDGIAVIAWQIGQFRSEVQVLCSRETSATVDVFDSWVENSLGEDVADAVDLRIAGKSPVTDLQIFTTQNHAAQTYVRSTSCWAADIDLTCLSPWNNRAGSQRAGTAITPRHIINAAHFELQVGDTVRFVTTGNQVVNRTITGKARHPDYQPYFPDLTVYTLDSALPETITPCAVLPADWSDYLKQVSKGRPPALCLDQEEKALVTDVSVMDSWIQFRVPSDSQRLAFYETKIGGDSGNPAFLIINGEPVLLTVWTNGGAGGGTFIPPQISALNAMIATADAQAGVSTGLEVTTIDLSTFTDFS